MSDSGVSRRVILKNVLDPATWSLIETLKNVSVALDKDGNVIAIPTFSINPQQSPIPAGGSIGNVGIASGANVATVRASNNNGEALFSDNTLSTTSLIGLFNQLSANTNFLEEPTGIIGVSAQAASTTTNTTLVAAVAAKKYRIFALGISGTFGAGTATATINEATSGLLLMSLTSQGGAANAQSLNAPIPPGGVLQPTANNAIQLTITSAAVTSAFGAFLIYGAAR